MRSADHGVDARELAEAQVWRGNLARKPADRRARMEAANIEVARGLPDLEPHIAGERLVGALAGEHGLVALRMHVARQREQRGAGRVEHRALRGADQPRIIVGDDARLGLDHRRRAADMVRRFARMRRLVELGTGT